MALSSLVVSKPGAPPTQGRARAQSQLVATEKRHHAMIVALVPNAEFTIKTRFLQQTKSRSGCVNCSVFNFQRVALGRR